jgi:DNA mismatch repair ATPase MutL
MRVEVERAAACPHGRPTSIRIARGELERRFGRS